MTMPDVSGLPVNVDSTYEDSATDPGQKLHQQHHDIVHGAVKALDVNKVDSPDFDNIVQRTQAQYDTIVTKDPRTLYVIVG